MGIMSASYEGDTTNHTITFKNVNTTNNKVTKD